MHDRLDGKIAAGAGAVLDDELLTKPVRQPLTDQARQTGLGSAYFYEGHFDQAVTYAEAAIAQNPRFTVALRLLAAGLARLGQREKAAAAVRELLNIEPQLTLSGLCSRVRFLEETPWGNTFVDALRLAGVPE